MSYQLFPPPCDLAREFILAWMRVGHESLALLSYVMQQNGPSTVSDSEREE